MGEEASERDGDGMEGVGDCGETVEGRLMAHRLDSDLLEVNLMVMVMLVMVEMLRSCRYLLVTVVTLIYIYTQTTTNTNTNTKTKTNSNVP